MTRDTVRLRDIDLGDSLFRPGPIEQQVRNDIAGLGDLTGVGPSLAELAYRLAQSLDSSEKLEGRELAPVAAQLRETLKTIAEAVGEPDDPAITGLSSPVYGRGGSLLPPAVGNRAPA